MSAQENPSLTRRKSYGILRLEENNVTEGFPRRHSLVAKPASGTLVRRNSEFTLPEIQAAKKIETNHKSKLCRQFSMINVPKTLTERPNKKKESSKEDRKLFSDDLPLPRVPSATPEPEAIRRISQCRDQETLENEFKNGSYRPKHCWCFRCQLMYCMFKAGDDRLNMWGNYPCFKR